MSDPRPEPPRAPIHPGRDPSTAPASRGPDEGVRTKPLAMAILACAVVVVLTTMLAPADEAFWQRELVRPEPGLPDLAVVVLELLRIVGLGVFAVVLYRAQVILHDPARVVVLALLLGTMLLQATWNPLLARFESLTAGVVAAGVLAGAMVALVVVLLRRDRLSAALLVPYALIAVQDFRWARELARLNPGA
jgi:tryptophan-rich sensory protein